jgi:recombinational DNA repair protein (RecF pathway)
VSDITFIKGRGEVGTLVSTRLARYYQHIVKDLDRTMLGYELIKQLHKVTESETEEEYFDLLRDAFEALDDLTISLQLVRFWFSAQLLRVSGHTPNLKTDEQGNALVADKLYEFHSENMSFIVSPNYGQFNAMHIKFLRLAFAGNTANILAHVQGSGKLVAETQPLVQHLTQLAY